MKNTIDAKHFIKEEEKAYQQHTSLKSFKIHQNE